jgi:VIT1/CCC1 family predicted Fe2+/Mn2+ transporter
LVPFAAADRFQLAVGLALITLFLVGASRAAFTDRTTLRAGFEMLAIGALAAGLAYVVGAGAARITGIDAPV